VSSNIRLIPRLDIKGSNLIKGVNLEGLRIIGSPNEFALKYYNQGADELIFMDCVASLYGRNCLSQIVKEVTTHIFIPITVGGGIRSVSDAKAILRSGADKVAVNTAAVENPGLITEIAQKFGSQCVVSSIEAKNIGDSGWEVFVLNGREGTGLDVVEWAKSCVKNGAGEIFLTSIDNEGTRKGFDIDLIKAVSTEVNVPVIASGGMGKLEDLISVVKEGGADSVAMADILHYERASIPSIRTFAESNGISVRRYEIS
jgi:cyclase